MNIYHLWQVHVRTSILASPRTDCFELTAPSASETFARAARARIGGLQYVRILATPERSSQYVIRGRVLVDCAERLYQNCRNELWRALVAWLLENAGLRVWLNQSAV